MPAHRYWCLYIFAPSPSSWGAVEELILATEPGGAQAAVGGVASSAATYSSSHEASDAFDGDPDTYWYANGYPASLVYDMGAGKSIDVVEIRLSFPSAGVSTSYAPQGFMLLHSDDGISWRIQRAWLGQSFSAGETKIYDATPIPANLTHSRIVLRRDIRYNSGANVGAPSIRAVWPMSMSENNRHSTRPTRKTPFSGDHYISGQTTVLGTLVARRVDLIDQRSGLLVDSCYTGADGEFRFDYIGPGPWTLVGVDSAAEQNSVIYAHLKPARMT